MCNPGFKQKLGWPLVVGLIALSLVSLSGAYLSYNTRIEDLYSVPPDKQEKAAPPVRPSASGQELKRDHRTKLSDCCGPLARGLEVRYARLALLPARLRPSPSLR